MKSSAPSLPWRLGKLRLELGMIMGVAADVAGAARSGADLMKRGFHRFDDGGVLAHAEIVVRAPDGDRLRAVAAEAMRVREIALGAQDIDEHAIAAFVVKPLDRGFEDAVVVQGSTLACGPLAAAPRQCHCEQLAKRLDYKLWISPIP